MKPNFKYAVIHRHCERYPIKEMCCFFEVSRSGYYKYLKHIEHPAKDFKLAEKIRAKQETCRRTYGYRRMKLWLDSEGIAKNPKTVLRIMHKYGLLSEVRRRKINIDTTICSTVSLTLTIRTRSGSRIFRMFRPKKEFSICP